MPWPSHLAEDVVFDHAAAVAAVTALHDLAGRIDEQARRRAVGLAAADHFHGSAREAADALQRHVGRRAAAVAAALRAGAARIEGDAMAARAAHDRLVRARHAWAREQQRVVG